MLCWLLDESGEQSNLSCEVRIWLGEGGRTIFSHRRSTGYEQLDLFLATPNNLYKHNSISRNHSAVAGDWDVLVKYLLTLGDPM